MNVPLLLVCIAAAAVGGGVGRLAVGRTFTRSGKVDCALRFSGDEPGSIATKWRHGVAEARPGALHSRPGGPGGLRFPRGTPRTTQVLSIPAVPVLRPRFCEIWWLNPSTRIAVLDTAEGPLQIAAAPRDLDAVRQKLDPRAES